MSQMIVALICLNAAGTADDGKLYPECTYCGMDRQKFGYGRMLLQYNDGTVVRPAASTAPASTSP
jgi:copper chaperone NosL